MSAAPLNTEPARRTHQRRSHPILLNLAHTPRLSLCLIQIAWTGQSVWQTSSGRRTGVGRAWKQASGHKLGRIYSYLLIYWSL